MFLYDENNIKRLWIHLHGFVSNVMSSKLQLTRQRLYQTEVASFFAMDMNYEKHTTTEVLKVLEALILGFSQRFDEIILCGSSHGAYVSVNYLRFMERGNIKTLILLAPSFRTLDLIVREVGPQKAKPWLEGKKPLKIQEEGIEVEVNDRFAVDILKNGYEIIKDSEVLFSAPSDLDIYIVHGTKDSVVPFEDSLLFTKKVKVKRFIKVDDDHQLSNTYPSILEELIKEIS